MWYCNNLITFYLYLRLNATEEELVETILHIWNEFKKNSESSI